MVNEKLRLQGIRTTPGRAKILERARAYHGSALLPQDCHNLITSSPTDIFPFYFIPSTSPSEFSGNISLLILTQAYYDLILTERDYHSMYVLSRVSFFWHIFVLELAPWDQRQIHSVFAAPPLLPLFLATSTRCSLQWRASRTQSRH